MTVYVKYDRKPPKLPVAVADSDEELAAMVGKSVNVIRSSISHGLQTYQRIEIGDIEENESALFV
jgi:pyruvate kinase